MPAAQASPDRPRTEESQPSRSASPCQLLWYGDGVDLSPRSSAFYSDLFSLYTNEDVTDATPASSPGIGQHMESTPTTSMMTTFPSFVSYNAQSGHFDSASYPFEREANEPAKGWSFFKKHLQRAKEIYQGGPPGEAELFWAGVRDYMQKKGKIEATEMCPRPPKRDSEAPKPPPKHGSVSIKHKVWDEQRRLHDSAVSYGDISRTSREVLIKLRQPVDMGKPLPPFPPLSPAPKRRTQEGKGNVPNVNKPLPITPLPYFSEISKPIIEPISESPVDERWPSTGMQTVDRIPPVPQRTDPAHAKHTAPKPQPSALPLPKPTIAHLQCAGKYKSSKTEKAHIALKAKISYPIPILPPANFFPAIPGPQPHVVDRSVEGEQKISVSRRWFDRFPHPPTPDISVITKARKRPDSNESFACQGLAEHGELGVRVEEGKSKAGVQSEDALRPEPLFTGDGEDMGRRMTGRWI
ncbi:hypothetical protein E8E13_009368 [Curvularia kusanoi]|uniref:Uncharacterized protein n=1 Tax=Curvularia kusanoi TaxID=90978 RepID=A0A9P4WCL7_CURKU|nr:hypothetical protein E8E13_009368 [Curvularia kusanoi]